MSARRVKRTGKRITGFVSGDDLPFGSISAKLARRLSGVPGADFFGCVDCGSALTPVMVMVGNRAEVCGIACWACQTFAPVCVGVVMMEEPVQ